MRCPVAIALTAILVVAACGDTSDPPAGSGQSALGTYRDGCDANVCGAQPTPARSCFGGYPTSVCTKARGACGWQVDCVSDPPPDFFAGGAIGNCPDAASSCGAVPAFDELDCVWGYSGEPTCERLDKNPCTWTRRCRPAPCDRTGTCNTLDRSKVGARCGNGETCPEGSSCNSVSVNFDDYVPASCILGNPCDALTCAAGRSCAILESFPGQVVCGK